MTNQYIDRRLAKAMGYKIDEHTLGDVIRVYKDAANKVPRYFRPTTNMQDAWDVAERFGLGSIINGYQGWLADYTDGVYGGPDKSPEKAICFGALKKIRNIEKFERTMYEATKGSERDE